MVIVVLHFLTLKRNKKRELKRQRLASRFLLGGVSILGDGQPAGFHLFSPERLAALIATVPSTHHGSWEKSTYRTQLLN